jgi:hypothetical protein
MKRKRCPILVFLFLMVFIISCGESFFSPENKLINDVTILSPENGGTIEQGETLFFEVSSTDEDEKPDKLSINLYSSGGELIGTLENASFALNEQLSLDLFNTLDTGQTGQYTIEFILFSGQKVLSEKKMTFFYTKEKYGITGIESFPPVIFPGATVLLTAFLSIPEESNPYVRWTIDEKLIARGYMSEGVNKILWSAPEEEGVFTVRIELFPTGPIGIDDFLFSSENYMDVELFVTETGKPSTKRLYPSESYYSLFHFEGDLYDSGKGSPPVIEEKYRGVASPIGTPELITTDEDFGYYCEADEGFRIPESIVPVKDGILKPFTISCGLLLEPEQEGKNIIQIRSLDNLFSLTIYIENDGTVFAKIQSGMKEVFIPSKINSYALEKRFLLSLSIIPLEKTLNTMWFLDGIPMGDFTVNDINLEIITSGVTIIGGENGINGIIDELGVYFKDSLERYTINPNLYQDAIRYLYDDNTLFAEGFDGLYIPENVQVEGDDIIDIGRLILKTSLSIVISPVSVYYEEVSIIIDYDQPVHEKAKVSFFWEGGDTPFMDVFSNGQISPGGQLSSVLLKNIVNSLYIKLSSYGSRVTFVNEEEPVNVSIKRPLQNSQRIIMKIINNDDRPIVIDSITVLKNRE